MGGRRDGAPRCGRRVGLELGDGCSASRSARVHALCVTSVDRCPDCSQQQLYETAATEFLHAEHNAESGPERCGFLSAGHRPRRRRGSTHASPRASRDFVTGISVGGWFLSRGRGRSSALRTRVSRNCKRRRFVIGLSDALSSYAIIPRTRPGNPRF